MASLDFEHKFILHDNHLDVNEIVINTTESIFNDAVELLNFDDPLAIKEAKKESLVIKEPPVGRHIAKKNAGQHPRRYCQNTKPDVRLCLDKQQNYHENVTNRGVCVENIEQTVRNSKNMGMLVQPGSQVSRSNAKKQHNLKPSVKVYLRTSSRTTNKTKVNQTSDIRNKTENGTKQYTNTKLNKFVCEVCNKSFVFRSQVIRHLSSHTGIRKFTCEYCNKQFMNNYNLTVHLRKHTGNFPLKCPVCRNGFSNPSVLKRHMISHTHEAKFECSLCSKRFGHASSLRLHEKMHEERPMLKCTICSKVFAYKSSLRSHVKLHSGVKLHVCDVCQKSFSRNTTLQRHMKGHIVSRCGKAKKKRTQCKNA